MGYWALAVGLITFGVLGMFSIGLPFFIVGVTMLVLGRLRHRSRLFWPPLFAVIGYVVGYWAVLPTMCAATAGYSGPSTTTCSSLIGVQYGEAEAYNLARDLAQQSGIVLGAIAFFAVLAVTMWRTRTSPRTDAGLVDDA